MPISNAPSPGDIVVVPFPYADRLAEKRRPALVVSNDRLAEQGFVWVAMVTSALRHRQPFDVPVDDLLGAGLKVASMIRPTKIACIEPKRIIRRAGELGDGRFREVLAIVRSFIGGPVGVRDLYAPGFAEEMARQSRAIAESPGEADDQAFVDSITDWND